MKGRTCPRAHIPTGHWHCIQAPEVADQRDRPNPTKRLSRYNVCSIQHDYPHTRSLDLGRCSSRQFRVQSTKTKHQDLQGILKESDKTSVHTVLRILEPATRLEAETKALSRSQPSPTSLTELRAASLPLMRLLHSCSQKEIREKEEHRTLTDETATRVGLIDTGNDGQNTPKKPN